MNRTDVTREGLQHVRPGREATTGVNIGVGEPAPAPRPALRGGGRGEQPMVPDAEFASYYGKPVINQPVWGSPDIPGYLFLGGAAGAGSVMAAAAQLTGRRRLSRALKMGSTVSVGLSLAALVHDLGRRGRFLNMLRTFKVTSPMSVGSWLLSAYGPAAAAAALSDVTGLMPGAGALATAGAAALGPGVATYTAALISNTAVPAWHDAYRDMPFVFAASAVSSAAALGMIAAPVAESGPVKLLGGACGAAEVVLAQVMERRAGIAGEAFTEGKAKRFHDLGQGLLLGGVGLSVVPGRSRLLRVLAGSALLSGSALTRFAIFEAGLASAHDPKYTVVPQRERLRARGGAPTGLDGRAPAGPGYPGGRRPSTRAAIPATTATPATGAPPTTPTG